MNYLKPLGRISYGVGIAGIGALQFVFPWFRPVLLPIPASATDELIPLVYLFGLALVLLGLYIAFREHVRSAASTLGVLFLIFFVFGHLPSRLTHNPGVLGAWTDALKLLALSGGAFMVAHLFPDKTPLGFFKPIDKFSAHGRYFFALMLVLFGIDHFIYTDFVKTLVPAWIPNPPLWTYVGGIALIGGGLAIFLHFRKILISGLLSSMLYIWLIVLHLPRAFESTRSDNGNEWTSVFECLAFAGMALLWRYFNKPK